MAKKQPKKSLVQSGAVGGPGTGAGLNFQVDFAVLQALEKISHALVNPLELGEISMEPRLVNGSSATCWDVRTSPPEVVTEAKLKPKREEILDWLDRVELGNRQTGRLHFELFYGRGAGRLLSAVERLCRIAKEAGGSREKFDERVNLERTSDVDEVLKRLKTDPHSSLLRVQVVPFDSAALKRDIALRLRHLVHEPARQRLNDFLTGKFHRGIVDRVTYKIIDLQADAEKTGIVFLSPPSFRLTDLEPTVSSAIIILENCEFGIPQEVLAAALDCTSEKLTLSLFPYSNRGILSHEDGRWAIAPLKTRLLQDDSSSLLERTLRNLLEFIRANKQNSQGWDQVLNAIALAKVCRTDHAELVSSLFWRLDKLLKRTGNKRLVLEIADLSIAAARYGSRTEFETKGEAVALVCGRSWVYQRINQLREARAEGEKSLELGKKIDWDRNTAFCLKCLGRLYRMEAEQQANDSAKRDELLRSSIDNLMQAIELFPQVSELPERDRSSEVGDCFSLLGRTYVIAGNRTMAHKTAKEAVDRITDTTSKDYADLQILLGDLAWTQNDKLGAVSRYEEAIEVAGTSDAEKSEIAARGWYQMALVTGEGHYFDMAAKIWDRLEEDESADKARWQSIKRTEEVSPSASEILSGESPSVRVEVLRLHKARLAMLTGPSRGRRSEPDKKYWKDLVQDATRNVAIRHKTW